MFSISVYGDKGVGKTAFCEFFLRNGNKFCSSYYDHIGIGERTIYPIILSYPICRAEERIRIFLVEGETEIKGDAALFLFNSCSSYEEHNAIITKWLRLNKGPGIVILTKGDLSVEYMWARGLVMDDDFLFQVSAKTGYNMDKPMRCIIDYLREKTGNEIKYR